MVPLDRFTVVLDACTLFSMLVRDVLLTLANHGFFSPKWSPEIREEWMRHDLGCLLWLRYVGRYGSTIAPSMDWNRYHQSIVVILKRLEDSFGASALESLVLDGIPRDMESALALANKRDDRVRKEFRALLTYSKNRATVNEKKGADKGIDGTAYFVTGHDATNRVIFQVKSGKMQRPVGVAGAASGP